MTSACAAPLLRTRIAKKETAVADEPPDRIDVLLRWCAILRRCDVAALRDLGGCGAEDIRALVAQGLLQPTSGEPASYILGEETRRETLVRLRQRPRAEIDLHAHALHYFIRQMQLP